MQSLFGVSNLFFSKVIKEKPLGGSASPLGKGRVNQVSFSYLEILRPNRGPRVRTDLAECMGKDQGHYILWYVKQTQYILWPRGGQPSPEGLFWSSGQYLQRPGGFLQPTYTTATVLRVVLKLLTYYVLATFTRDVKFKVN